MKLSKLFSTLALSVALSPAAFAADAPLRIGVSMASDVNPFYITMKKGIIQRAEEIGAKAIFVTANEVVAQQVDGLQDLVAQGVDGILISPIDAVAVRGGYATAGQAGIPVISIARHTDSPHQSAFVSMDEKKVGQDIAEWLVKAIDGEGEVAMITGPAGAATFRNMAEGFDSVLENYPNVKVVLRKDAPLTREDGLRLAEDALIANPDLKGIYTANDELALGASQAVNSAGKKGEVIITGLNGIPPAIKAVKAGNIGMTVNLNPYDWGYMAVDTMVNYLENNEGQDLVAVEHTIIDINNVDE